MLKILVTGSSGFIGSALFNSLHEKGHKVKGTFRSSKRLSNKNLENFFFNVDIDKNTDWSKILVNVDFIVHCAGQNSDVSFFKKKNLVSYKNINVEGTKNLAYQAAKAGVKRIVFLSSAKVFGEKSKNLSLLTKNSKTSSLDPYGISKIEAEKELMKISEKTGIQVTIIRFPIVYGKGVKGNFEKLMKWISFGFPIPFGLIKNKRSFVGLDNLLDLIVTSLNHPNAAGEILLATDDHDLSTVELLSKISLAMNRNVKIFSVNISLIRFFGYLVGKSKEISSLIDSLQIDITHTKKLLNWKPRFNVDEGIKKMVEDFKAQSSND